MNDQDFRKIFTDHKVDIPDEDFSERVIRQLPERKSKLPQIVMIFFITVGLVFTFAIQGVIPFFEQINSLITSIGRLQAPSIYSIITYINLLIIAGVIGYSIVHVGEG